MLNSVRNLVIVSLGWAAAMPAAASTIFRITDLGALSGGASSGAGINDSGQTAGSSLLVGGARRATLQNGGLPGNLGAPFGGSESLAASLNNAGQAVGTTYTTAGPRATLWSSGGAFDLGTLGGSDAFALSINNRGQVAGGAATADGQLRGFVFTNAAMENIGVLPGGAWSSAYAINDAGQVAGTSEAGSGRFRAFAWSPLDGMLDLGTLGGASSYGTAINASGLVVGHAQTGSGFLHVFLWDPRTGMSDLGTLGGTQSFAYGVNAAGWVVGASFVTNSENEHAFLYRAGVLVDLNSLVEAAPGWELTEASGVNSQGQIVGTGLLNGVERAYRLDPLEPFSFASDALGTPAIHNPEPGTYVLIATGLLILGLWKRKKSRIS